MPALSGLLSVMLVCWCSRSLVPGRFGIAWALGAYAMAGGVILIALGVRLRSKQTAVLV